MAAKKIKAKNKTVKKQVKPSKAPVKNKLPKSKNIAKKPQSKTAKKTPIKKTIAKSVKKETIKKSTVKSVKKEVKPINSVKKESVKNPTNLQKLLTPTKSEEIKKEVVKKPEISNKKTTFKVGDYAVYPSHGVGQITAIETVKVMGQDFGCYIMKFEREKLIIRIPVESATKVGLRALSSKAQLEEVFSILRSGIKKLKGMWSRRAQEYETKINSGDVILLAEVLRDLTRDIEDGDRSYSERIIYETAIQRLASEYSTVYKIDFEEAKEKVIITAKDKLISEAKSAPKDDFDDFDRENGDEEDMDEEEEDEDEDEDGDEDEDYDDDDEDEKPRKKRK